ncbi:uncharacterized protein EV420DRAFT_1478527 [Desarmillaria tabescens]|uniref:Uncharacterized protein n=1 Tax=Armillaria tabescens TaxID=1929756 RepID=A0AA39KHM1_ARMTA|nr:uncharacterized protein EV420DRAFT_1478527 [Desarmillaria tabescens]KAK0459984.1 hypothetical protein EV420DRAFT_1478527 [Desarmillaria tabescens]
MVGAVPPFVLAVISIVLLGSVALMIMILPAPYSRAGAGWVREQSDAMQRLNLGSRDPRTVADAIGKGWFQAALSLAPTLSVSGWAVPYLLFKLADESLHGTDLDLFINNETHDYSREDLDLCKMYHRQVNEARNSSKIYDIWLQSRGFEKAAPQAPPVPSSRIAERKPPYNA